jgi:hypothetical protein
LGDFVALVIDEKGVSAHLGGMKAVYFQTAGAIAVTFALAACISNAASSAPQSIEPEPTIVAEAPPVTPQPVVEPRPAPSRPAEPVFRNYLDAPRSQGSWTYIPDDNGGQAAYGSGGSNNTVFALTCFKAAGQIGLMRMIDGSNPSAIRIKTETTERTLDASPIDTQSNILMALVVASDPILDSMAITKGRFVVAVEGERTLYLPAWAEVTRVIEDCR